MTAPTPETLPPEQRPLLPTILAALRALLGRDTLTQTLVFILALVYLLHLLGLDAYLTAPPYFRIATALATLLMTIACWADYDRVDQRELPFWRTMILATVQLTLVALLRAVLSSGSFAESSDLYRLLVVIAELLRIGGLLSILLAVHSRPHESSRQKLAHFERSAGLPTALLLALCAVFYFGIVPVAHDGNLGRLGLVVSLSLLPLNAYLVFRCLYWGATSNQPRWQTIYLLVGLTLAIFPLSTARSAGTAAGNEVAFFAEVFGCLLAIFAFRVRHFRFPTVWLPEKTADPAVARINPGSRSLLLATLVPILHITAYRLRIFDEGLRASREEMLVLWMLIAALVSAAQHRRARKLAAELVGDRRRIEAALLRSERDLQLAEERRRADEKLFRSRDKYQRAISASPYALLITAIEDGKILEVNDRALEITGYQREELVGHSTIEMNIWADLEQRNRFLAELRARGRAENFELTFRRRDGEVHRGVANAEVLELQGKPSMLALIRDRTLDEFQEKQRRNLLDVFLGTQTPILAVDEQKRLIAWNPAATLLFGPITTATPQLADLVTDRASLLRLERACAETRGKGASRYPVELLGASGQRRFFEVHSVETAESGLPVAYLLIFVEIVQT